jgi:hypothetical protein
VRALVGLLPAVDAHVAGEVGADLELGVAHGALEGGVAGVSAEMDGELRRVLGAV